MKAKCHLAYGNDVHPDYHIKESQKKHRTYTRLPVVGMKVATSSRPTDSFSETLEGLARNQVIDLQDFVSGLVLVGTRRSILDLFEGKVIPTIKICAPVYIAVHRKHRLLKDDVTVVKISAERSNKLNPQKFANNAGRQLIWRYTDVTRHLNLHGGNQGWEVTPQVFVQSLKTLFDGNG